MRLSTLLLAGALASFASAAAAAPASQAQPSSSCRKLPPGKRRLKLSLKPNSEVADLIAWISSVTCKEFILPAGLGAGKTVTVIAPQLITPEEAYALFLDALDSVGLTVYPSGRFLRVIEVEQAKKSPIPVVVPGAGR
jgi:general secretion pathway protein D